MSWLVLDMDDGLLRREPSRKAAVKWFMNHCCATRVLSRDHYRPGAYGYYVGNQPDDGTYAFIEHVRAAGQGGWDIDQPALYPHEDKPHEHVERPKEDQ